jgi:uncharacterized protein YndB with AHSA1/START domain|tara:strand:- start:8006 stop:8926 length:921 start_codon:yes stop_codon:yes gene_type:complete
VKTNEILDTLERLHAAQKSHDVDEMLKAYAGQGFVSAGDMRTYFEGMIKQDAFAERTVDMTQCETFVHGDSALVKPVIYHTRKGPRCFSFHLNREDDGQWRIIDNNRSQSRDEQFYSAEFMANAGKVVGFSGMLWVRRLDVPVEDVWAAISTEEGLDKWWLTRSVEIDLRPGGLFRHHWTNTIREFKTNEYIDFMGVPEDKSLTDYLMRFELKPDGEGTVFSFLDTFNGAKSPLSLPWTASGWHGTVDALETALTGRSFNNDFGLGGEFYWRYLRDFHKFADMASRLKAPDTTADEWREAYLSASH